MKSELEENHTKVQAIQDAWRELVMKSQPIRLNRANS